MKPEKVKRIRRGAETAWRAASGRATPHATACSRVVRGLAVGLCLAVGLATPAYATVIVSQSHDPDLPGKFSNFVTGDPAHQQVADNFGLAGPVTLTALSWAGQYDTEQTSLTNPVQFRIRFFEDDGGLPASTALSIVDVAVTGTPTGTSFDGSPWLAYSTALPLLSLTAGDYWVSILEFDTQTPAAGGSQWLWGRSDNSSVASAVRGTETEDWAASGGNMAFTLEGRGAVPEPAALGVFGIGLLGLAAFRRRRRTA